MERLFLFVYQNRAFFTFLTLEILCIWLIVSSNHYQSAQYFNASNNLVANINSISYSVKEYFGLKETNLRLAEENARLMTELEGRRPAPAALPPMSLDSATANQLLAVVDSADTTVLRRYEFTSAKVVNNSVDRFTNFITIDKGSSSGIEVGMAVISTEGAVGKVKATSKNFAVVTSILNIDVMTSAMIKRTGHFGTVQWDGHDYRLVSLNYIPRHVKPEVGDSIVTSGYNTIFPKGILIGTIEETDLNDADPFYKITVRLSQDFQQLSYVKVVKSNFREELDSLETNFRVIP